MCRAQVFAAADESECKSVPEVTPDAGCFAHRGKAVFGPGLNLVEKEFPVGDEVRENGSRRVGDVGKGGYPRRL